MPLLCRDSKYSGKTFFSTRFAVGHHFDTIILCAHLEGMRCSIVKHELQHVLSAAVPTPVMDTNKVLIHHYVNITNKTRAVQSN